MPKWLEKAVFYEIYPQSFYDTNADGIGDLQGVIEKLDYVKDLGCNMIWLNPCFESPFDDAGYDVSDYEKIAPRYGTNEDMKRLLEAAHARGIRVILDLVAGHTSIEHPWFQASLQNNDNEFKNRYIWTDTEEQALDENLAKIVRTKLHKPKTGNREGYYFANYYDIQPALNFGFGEVTEDWQLPVDHPDCIATIEALKDVMRFWLDMGADGFRVDMAFSLVKNDTPDHQYTRKIWRNIRQMLDEEYPEAALISEWFIPAESIDAGFHVDFYLQASMGYIPLLMTAEDSFFHKNGEGDASFFAADYSHHFEFARQKGGYMSTPTGNHDIVRMSYNRTDDEIKMVQALVFSLPGLPGIYYGDEIGMRYQDLESKEGGLYRTGSRTPMQWDDSVNAGFSTTEDASALYLPIDPDENRPTVEKQEKDPKSILNFAKQLVAMRKMHPALANGADFKVLYAEEETYPFIFARISDRQRIVVCFNPSGEAAQAQIPVKVTGKVLLSQGGDPVVQENEEGSTIVMKPESFAFIEY